MLDTLDAPSIFARGIGNGLWGHEDAASLDYPPAGTRVGERGYLRRSGLRAWLGTAELMELGWGGRSSQELGRGGRSSQELGRLLVEGSGVY